MKQADLRHMFKKDSKSVCASTIVVSKDYLFLLHQLLQKTQETTEEDPDDTEPTGIIL